MESYTADFEVLTKEEAIKQAKELEDIIANNLKELFGE